MPREDPVKFMLQNMVRRMPKSEMERLGLIPSRSDATIMFSRYPDGTLRLYKRGSIIDDVPAGYSEENVTVKALVKRESEEFMVVIPITRTQLDTPSAEQFLHETAYSHRHNKPRYSFKCRGCGVDFNEFPEMQHSEEECPGPECTCYEVVGGHQPGCYFYGRKENESKESSDSRSGTSRSYLCSGSTSLSTSSSDSDAGCGEGSSDTLGTNERGKDSTP